MTGSDPLTVLPDEPQDHVREVHRAWFGLRTVIVLTVIVSALAALLVVILYMSPLAAR